MADISVSRKIFIVISACFILSTAIFITFKMFAGDDEGQALEGTWLSQIDSLGHGESQSWFRAGFNRSGWYEEEISQVNERHAVPHEPHAIVWYAKKFDFDGKINRTRMLFGGSDDDMKIWINGISAGIQIGYNDEFSVDVSSAVRNGENEVVIELINHSGSADFYAPIKLIPAENDHETIISGLSAVQDLPEKRELRNAVMCEADLRMLPQGSAFAVLRKKIPDIKRSGISLLCLSPLNPAGQMNRRGAAENPYSVQNYYAINSKYGSLGDLKSLISEAHSSGIKVIMDFVANCTSWDNAMLLQYPEWYVQNEKGEILAPYAGADDVAKLNYDRHELRKYMIAVLEHWSAKAGFDGFRCIGSGSIPVDFWLSVRIQLEKNKPVILISEENIPEQQEGAFDISGSFDIGVVLNKILRGTTSASVFQKLLSREARLFHEGTLFTRSDEFTKHSNDPGIERESIVFRLTHPGVPVLDLDEITGNADVLSLIGQFIELRMHHAALVDGQYLFLKAGDSRTTYSFARTMKSDTAAVIMNISNDPQTAAVKGNILTSLRWQDASAKIEYTAERNTLSLELPACGFAVLQPLK